MGWKHKAWTYSHSKPCSIYDLSTEQYGHLVYLYNSFCTTSANSISLSWQAPEDPYKRLYSIWSGSRVPQLAKESVAPTWLSLADWMPKKY